MKKLILLSTLLLLVLLNNSAIAQETFFNDTNLQNLESRVSKAENDLSF